MSNITTTFNSDDLPVASSTTRGTAKIDEKTVKINNGTLSIDGSAIDISQNPSITNIIHSIEDNPSSSSPYRSVKDFGALGDGATDDTASFNKAIEYCSTNGYVVWVPHGTYMLRHVQILNNTTIKGDNPILKVTGNKYYIEETKYFGNLLECNTRNNVSFENLILDGNINKFPIDEDINTMNGIGLLRLYATQNVVINNCTFQNNGYGAIKMDAWANAPNIENVKIHNCTFKNVDSAINMQHRAPKNISIKGCIFDGHVYSEPIVLEVTLPNEIIEDVDICDNIFKNKTGAATIWLGNSNSTVLSTRRILIHDNIIFNMNTGITLKYCDDVSIFNNTITSAYVGIQMNGCQHIRVVDNTFYGYSAYSEIRMNNAIIGEASNSLFLNNNFNNCRSVTEIITNTANSLKERIGCIMIYGDYNIFKDNLFQYSLKDDNSTVMAISITGSHNTFYTNDLIRGNSSNNSQYLVVTIGIKYFDNKTSYETTASCIDNHIIHCGDYIKLYNFLSDASINGLGSNYIKKIITQNSINTITVS